MRFELDVVRDAEIVEERPLIHGESLLDEHEISAEITSGSSQVMGGALRIGRALEHARIRGTFDSVMAEHGLEKSQGYNLAKVWREFGQGVLDGTLTPLLEVLSPTHLIRALRAEEPILALEEAADQNLTVSQMDARIKRAEEPEGVEVAETRECEVCQGSGRVPVEREGAA